jgi:hypothetical protein
MKVHLELFISQKILLSRQFMNTQGTDLNLKYFLAER